MIFLGEHHDGFVVEPTADEEAKEASNEGGQVHQPDAGWRKIIWWFDEIDGLDGDENGEPREQDAKGDGCKSDGRKSEEDYKRLVNMAEKGRIGRSVESHPLAVGLAGDRMIDEDFCDVASVGRVIGDSRI